MSSPFYLFSELVFYLNLQSAKYLSKSLEKKWTNDIILVVSSPR